MLLRVPRVVWWLLSIHSRKKYKLKVRPSGMSLKSKREFSERSHHLLSGNDNHRHKNNGRVYLFVVVGTNSELANMTKLLQTQISEYWTIAPRSNTRLGSLEPQVTTFLSTNECVTLFNVCTPSSTIAHTWMKHIRHVSSMENTSHAWCAQEHQAAPQH